MHLSRTQGRRRALLATTTVAAALTLVGAAGAKTADGPTARAAAAPGTVKVNAGYTLAVRATPSSSGRVVRKLANDTKVRIVCQTQGDRVTGRFGTSTLWDKLSGGGYVSDTYVYTGSDQRVAPDCGGATTPVNTQPSPAPSSGLPASVKLRDDYPYPTRSWNGVDPWNFYFRECTSFVAYRISKVIRGFANGYKGGRFGNAMTWDDNARRIGMKVDRTPKVGSIMVRNSGRFGHVAIVAKVGSGGKRIFVEQYNAGGTHRYSKEWLTKTSVMTFIHP